MTLGLYLAPQTAANGVTQLLAAVPVQAPVTTAVEAVVQVTIWSDMGCCQLSVTGSGRTTSCLV